MKNKDELFLNVVYFFISVLIISFFCFVIFGFIQFVRLSTLEIKQKQLEINNQVENINKDY